jgi:twitching motility two-component system response regulator PilH
LVVDDDDETREMLQLALEDEGYEVCAASDGYEAIDIMLSKPPELVLLDLMTSSQMTSWQLVDRMKDDPLLATVPICVMTDGPEDTPPDTARVVAKPIGIDNLLDIVREQLA